MIIRNTTINALVTIKVTTETLAVEKLFEKGSDANRLIGT